MLKTEVLQSKALWENLHSLKRRNSHSIFTKTAFQGTLVYNGERQQNGIVTLFFCLCPASQASPAAKDVLPPTVPGTCCTTDLPGLSQEQLLCL